MFRNFFEERRALPRLPPQQPAQREQPRDQEHQHRLHAPVERMNLLHNAKGQRRRGQNNGDVIPQIHDDHYSTSAIIASMSKETTSSLLLFLTIIAAASAVATLLPIAPSRNPTIGYASWCPFAPVSTVILLLAAGVLWVIRQYIRTRLG